MGKLDSFVSRQPLRDIRVPALPNLGELLKERGLKDAAVAFAEQFEQWRRDLELQLRQLAPETEAPATPAATTTTTASVSNVDAVARTAIEAHAALTSAHGAAGNLVGEDNEQSLEKKSIGLAYPRYGRFTTLIGRDHVPSGEEITIPGGYYMIAPEDFYVDGVLVVEGSLHIV